MRITKSLLKQLIKEELENTSNPETVEEAEEVETVEEVESKHSSSPKLEGLMRDLLEALQKLDLSIDYLTSAITGEDIMGMGVKQTGLGRVAKARRAGGGRQQAFENKNETD